LTGFPKSGYEDNQFCFWVGMRLLGQHGERAKKNLRDVKNQGGSPAVTEASVLIKRFTPKPRLGKIVTKNHPLGGEKNLLLAYCFGHPFFGTLANMKMKIAKRKEGSSHDNPRSTQAGLPMITVKDKAAHLMIDTAAHFIINS